MAEAKTRQKEQLMDKNEACFEMHTHNAKNQEVHRDGHGGQRGSFGRKGGEEEAFGTIWMGISKVGAKK